LASTPGKRLVKPRTSSTTGGSVIKASADSASWGEYNGEHCNFKNL
jgi:hypothetical protein